MAQAIVNSAINDPASNLNNTAMPESAVNPPVQSQLPGVINSAVQPNSIGYNDIASSYQTLFGRPPDAEGAVFWQNAANSGGWTPEQLSQHISQGAQSEDQRAASALNGAGSLGTNWQQSGLDAAKVGAGVTWDDQRNQWVSNQPQTPGYMAALVGTPTKWDITKNQTIAGQIADLLDPNSPLVQQARAQGLEFANERGLLNSSIGESAAMDSAYKAVMPIAEGDAATYSKAAGYNADQKNQAAFFNANAQNQALQAGLSAQTQTAIANLQAQTQTDLGYLDAQTKTNLANLDATTRTNLANIEAQYHTIMQSSASASDLFRQITQNITAISQSKDMDAAAKQAAVDNQLSLLKSGMQINGAISNLNLGDLLDFSGANTPAVNTPVTSPSSDENGYGYDHIP